MLGIGTWSGAVRRAGTRRRRRREAAAAVRRWSCRPRRVPQRNERGRDPSNNGPRTVLWPASAKRAAVAPVDEKEQQAGHRGIGFRRMATLRISCCAGRASNGAGGAQGGSSSRARRHGSHGWSRRIRRQLPASGSRAPLRRGGRTRRGRSGNGLAVASAPSPSRRLVPRLRWQSLAAGVAGGEGKVPTQDTFCCSRQMRLSRRWTSRSGSTPTPSRRPARCRHGRCRRSSGSVLRRLGLDRGSSERRDV